MQKIGFLILLLSLVIGHVAFSQSNKSKLHGKLEIQIEDYAQSSNTRYFLLSDQRRYELKFKSKPSQLTSGSNIRVTGIQNDNVMYLDSSGNGSIEVLTMASLPNSLGEHKTLVLLVNFQDYNLQPFTREAVSAVVFDKMNGFYLENSQNQTWITGAVYGWFTLPLLSTSCTPSDIATQAKQAATVAGINISAYDHIIYVFPRITGSTNPYFFWSGQATTGNLPGDVWLNGTIDVKTVVHEFGHNLGLLHSHALECGTSALSNNCQNLSYGDTLDAMGNTNPAHFNAFQKEQLGWLNNNVPPITTVTTSGTFSIDPYESSTILPKALKVLKSTDPITGQKSWFYIEYRQAIGFDRCINTFDSSIGCQPQYYDPTNILNGVILRIGKDNDRDSSYLLDMTPSSSTYYDWNDPALKYGQSFTDPESGVVISVLAAGGSTATVNVNFGQKTCLPANPSLTISPSTGPLVSAGSKVTYAATVKNNDSSNCPTSVFNLSANTLSGWSSAFSISSMSLSPGASASTTLTVTSPLNTASGTYSISITALNSSSPSYSTSTPVTYSVTSSPVAVDDLVLIPTKTAVTINVLANDYDSNGKSLTVISFTQGTKGSVIKNIDGTLTYTPTRQFKSNDQFTYTISNGTIVTATAKVSIQLQSTGGRGK